MHHFLNDLRYAARLLVRVPGWTAVAVVSLSLGIGANAVVFSLVDAVLLDPFPYRDAGQLALLWGSRGDDQRTGISGADLADWREQTRTFEDIDAFLSGSSTVYSLGPSEADRVQGACIGHRVLPMLGVEPALGRNFLAEEAQYGARSVVLLSDALWRTRFDGEPSIVGRSVRLNDTAYDVVGVMPPGFFFPDTDAKLWVAAPCGFRGFEARGAMQLNAVGRIRPGVSVAAAQADIDTINGRLAGAYPETNARRVTGVFPLRRIVIGKYEQALWTLTWAIAVVLLIACVNVVHLQLARGIDREAELAVRVATGASRGRLMRLLLTETGLLVGISGFGALMVTWIGLRLIQAFALTDIPRMEGARLDVRVVAFAASVTIVSALVSGIWPAIKSSRVQVSDTLKLGSGATAGSGRSQIRDLLAITEIAAAVTLLVASGLVVKSFVLLIRADWGFIPEQLLLIDVKLPKDKWRDREFHRRFADDATAALKGVAGVDRVAISTSAPIRWSSWRPGPVRASGQTARVSGGEWIVGPGHFAAIGVPLLEGREFSASDDETAPPRVVVGRALARQLWPNRPAVGQRLDVLTIRGVNGKPDPDIAARMKRRDPTLYTDPSIWELRGGGPFEVIGVVGDVRMFALGVEGNPAFYVSTRQPIRNDPFMGGSSLKVLLRTTGAPTEVVAAAKARILAVDSSLSFEEVVPLADLVRRSVGGRGSPKLMVLVGSVFGALALGFATIGIYGVVAHNVAGRLREIGIRMALGADRREVVRMVVGYAMRLLMSGLALGVTIAWAATRGIRALLFATTPTDPATYIVVVVTLGVAALIACVHPLRTALRFDPVTLFRA